MVEMALVFPLLLLLAFSLADYGYYIEHVNNLDTIVRDGTRYASLHTTSQAWTNACASPTWDSTSGAWTCAGVTTTVGTGFSQSDPATYFATDATLPVSSATELLPYFTPSENVAVITSSTTSLLLTCSYEDSTDLTCSYQGGSGTVQAGETVAGTSDSVEAVIQQEAESLTVPEGGLAVDNVDCCWSTSPCSTTPKSQPGSAASASIPSGDISCMTVAYYGGDSSYGSSLALKGWYSASAGCYLPAGDTTCPATESYPQVGDNDLVQITVLYDYSQQSPGPIFRIMNSAFGLQANVVAQYSMAVVS